MLRAQQLGLNPCWVAMPHKKVPSAFRVEPGESLCCVISIGYGTTQGQAHTVKDRSAVMKEPGYTAPDRFLCGVDTALLAPPQPISKNSPSPVRKTGSPPKAAWAFTAKSTWASSNIILNRRPAPHTFTRT